jgi:DNA-binding response OmpR family regulator
MASDPTHGVPFASICDLCMGRMSGIEAAIRIRRLHALHHFILGNHDRLVNRLEHSEPGIRTLNKPLHPDLLLNQLRR